MRQAELLLDRGADPDAVYTKTGDTAALRAAANGHRDVLALLLARGVDLPG